MEVEVIAEKTEALYARLQKVLPFLISPRQCVDGRFTGECGTLIADILEIINLENIEDYFFLAIDFEKLISFRKIWLWARLYWLD